MIPDGKPVVLADNCPNDPPTDGQSQRRYTFGIDGNWKMVITGGSNGQIDYNGYWSDHPMVGDSKFVEWTERDDVWEILVNQLYDDADLAAQK